MQVPGERTARRRLYSTWGVFLLARLMLHTVTKVLSDTWAVVQKALKAAIHAVDDGWETRIIARAAVEWADVVLDSVIRKVVGAANVDLGGVVDHPERKKLFKVPPGEVVAMPFLLEIIEVKLIEAALAEGGIWKAAKALLGELKAAREGMEKALAGYNAARLAHRATEDKLDDAEMNWRHAYRATYGSVIEKFPADKRMVESFYWRAQDSEEATEEKKEEGTT